MYQIPGASIPIVHRVLETRSDKPKKSDVQPVTPKQKLLTKGDNNYVDDIDLYQGLEWLERKHIIGKVRGYVFLFFLLGSSALADVNTRDQVFALCWLCDNRHGKHHMNCLDDDNFC